MTNSIPTLLTAIYGAETASTLEPRVSALLERYRPLLPRWRPTLRWLTTPPSLSAREALLITYGDQVRAEGEPPLHTLAEFCRAHLSGVVSGVHILPFYPYSSDDGFSVIDYRVIDPALGTWADVARLGENFQLMFDAVVNHISAQSAWFQAFLRDEAPYRDYFWVVEGQPDLSHVVRPRTLPLLTTFETPSGPKAVWTTFSADQVDLDYRNPDVLVEMLDILLLYVQHGAVFIRLDAIAYLWKVIGTNCIHLPQTHQVIQLMRAVLDEVAPHVHLITETNVPHVDNISYFGDGTNEAQLVYNFALPPLTLHTLRIGNAQVLSEWAAGLGLPATVDTPSAKTTFFNFLASHDGIGVNPARGILPQADIDALVTQVQAHQGLVSFKNNPDGTQSPYELNINYFDALNNPQSAEPLETQVARFMVAQSIMLSLVGVPGIYVHSLLGSRGWPEGVRETGRNRTINRQKFQRAELEQALTTPGTLRHMVFSRYAQFLRARAASSAFDPHGAQQILDSGDSVFAVLRLALDGGERMLCLHNVSAAPQTARLGQLDVQRGVDVLTGEAVEVGGEVGLQGYEVRWVRV